MGKSRHGALAVTHLKNNLKQLLAQARSRGTLKVATAYIAFAWLVVSIVNSLVGIFKLPSAVPQVLFLLFALGFPIALLGAWKGWFGAARDAAKAGSLPAEGHGMLPTAVFTAITVISVAAATALTVYGLTRADGRGDSTAAGAEDLDAGTRFEPPAHSVAVLPFVNMSGDAEQQYFSDGLCEELLNALARVEQLQVAARTSSFSFKGKEVSIPQVARALNVGAVLEGSVRKEGARVRITAQLINAVTGFHLWSQTYDRDLREILALQTEIATAVADKLEATLLGSAASAVAMGGTSSTEAFDAYLRAHYMSSQPRPKEALLAQLAAYDKAIALDPAFANAYIGKADTLGNLGALMSGDSYEQARQAAEKAIELAPGLGSAHAGLGDILDGGFNDATGAQRQYERALELAPGNAYVLSAAAQFFSAHGEPEKALGYGRRAVVLDPLNTQVHRALGFVFYALRKFPDAVSSFDRALELSRSSPQVSAYRGFAHLMLGKPDAALDSCATPPRDVFAEFCMAMAYQKLRRKADAQRQLDALMKEAGEDFSYQYAQLYAQWGDRPTALKWLEAAQRIRDPGLAELKVDPLLDPLRKEPRFKAIEQGFAQPAS